jgi:hypothetical protein
MVIKDSGTRRDFNSGAVRDGETGKGRFDLIPPVMLDLLAKHFEAGAVKYEDRNWEKGMPLSVYLDSALRHINKYRDGQRDEPHMVAALWNLTAFIHTREMINRGVLSCELDDVPTYYPVKKYTAYFSHHIRGPKGAGATLEEQQENKQDAIHVCNEIRKQLPMWDIYCPAEADAVVSELFQAGALDEAAILAADCKILERKDAVIAYQKDGVTSKGMEVEINHAYKLSVPIISFRSLNKFPLDATKRAEEVIDENRIRRI